MSFHDQQIPCTTFLTYSLIFLAACFADLMCYVCDDCDKVTKQTPLLACNEDFFNQGGSTEASTVTTTTMTTPESTETSETTDASTTSSSTTSSPLTTFSETTLDPTSSDDTTTPQFTELTTNGDETTEAPQPPTPGTVQPPESTTLAPTPPSVDELQATSSTLPAIRQRRSLIDTGVTYHCYSIQKTGDYSPFSLSLTLQTNAPLSLSALSQQHGEHGTWLPARGDATECLRSAQAAAQRDGAEDLRSLQHECLQWCHIYVEIIAVGNVAAGRGRCCAAEQVRG